MQSDPRSPLERLAALPEGEQKAFLAGLSEPQSEQLLGAWRGGQGRPAQIAPDGDWSIWLILAGRGFGKTRAGSEWCREEMCGSTPMSAGRGRRLALIAETAADGRDVMVEGESGILAVHPKDYRPLYEPSKRRLTWPNGAVATLYNGTEPDQLRGPQHDRAWADEIAKWQHARATWDQLQFGMRLGAHPKQVVTTTPRPIELVRDLVARSNAGTDVVLTRGRTMDNAGNLAAPFLRQIEERYAGTRLGRQELEGEILDDVPGALWTRRMLDEHRLGEAPHCERIVVAVDPAVEAGEDADEHGIVVCGRHGQRGVVLSDRSVHGTPEQWARRAVSAYREFDADRIIAEANNGGQMVAHTIRSVDPNVPVTLVKATRGKHVRAEPISALYEQGRIAHVGAFSALEDQMVLMTSAGYEGEASPDRLDALVWGFTELFPSMTRRTSSKPIKYGKLANVA